MSVKIRSVAAEDRAEWDALYQGYATFYKVDQTAEMRDRVFGWLMDEQHTSNGLVAVDGAGKLIGLTHYRPFVSCLGANTNCFLDDLFVDPAARGSGAADALIKGVAEIAQSNGWGKVRWITADDNYRGRGVYDKLATRTMWVTYDMPL
ncbi:Acetyltransferase [Sulfitobacter noctilucicola]|uniref:GNAT superfamily N-acetyltransferase n=1 Tax=Sulfitobacter noctilucicola TaxID=1342301 RepID=A0A7W6Q347_9RHOB|nr:GNAT family N-acetyltransferase [Sulfitobacter noctilucicola]KIN65097.1 Acetyltransferase [Sulfitobacter noctilucicola]MBB4173765.1 GNAT superfamily N-acetyltransferase [Sulfitobacter noctilucicola]